MLSSVFCLWNLQRDVGIFWRCDIYNICLNLLTSLESLSMFQVWFAQSFLKRVTWTIPNQSEIKVLVKKHLKKLNKTLILCFYHLMFIFFFLICILTAFKSFNYIKTIEWWILCSQNWDSKKWKIMIFLLFLSLSFSSASRLESIKWQPKIFQWKSSRHETIWKASQSKEFFCQLQDLSERIEPEEE